MVSAWRTSIDIALQASATKFTETSILFHFFNRAFSRVFESLMEGPRSSICR